MITEQYIDTYLKNYKNYKNYWNYEDGCILSGCIRLFEATGLEKYSNFIFRYLSSVISDDGQIINYDNSKHSIDSFNSGKSLIFAFERTGDEKYRKAAEFLYSRLKSYPRTGEGSFIHKSIYPDQVWLDGLYMAQPFYASCIRMFGNGDFSDITVQFSNARKNMFRPEKKLYCHGYDSARIQPWADTVTGQSPSFWLRSSGWFLMSLVDTWEAVGNESDPCSILTAELFREAAEGLLEYADKKSGLFYQVTDMGSDRRNYTETSGSLMISYALLKSVHLGINGNSGFAEAGKKIFRSVIEEKMKTDSSQIRLTDICCSAGLGPGKTRNGTAEYYYSEKIVSDDPKGAGSLMMAYAEILKENSVHREALG
ncbi:MAG: glycoside hydrolase family 88 protein [Oscillospiraceae bacterium]|nr:glycoside hydrolase family 88 protein [Oscillospiraceae bacterium]